MNRFSGKGQGTTGSTFRTLYSKFIEVVSEAAGFMLAALHPIGLEKQFSWGCSSVGRAPDLHSGGRRFDPDQLHQLYPVTKPKKTKAYLSGPVAQLSRAHR